MSTPPGKAVVDGSVKKRHPALRVMWIIPLATVTAGMAPAFIFNGGIAPSDNWMVAVLLYLWFIFSAVLGARIQKYEKELGIKFENSYDVPKPEKYVVLENPSEHFCSLPTRRQRRKKGLRLGAVIQCVECGQKRKFSRTSLGSYFWKMTE